MKFLVGPINSKQTKANSAEAGAGASLRSLRPDGSIQVKTVDGFQGNEQDIIIISCLVATSARGTGCLQASRGVCRATLSRCLLCKIGSGRVQIVPYHNRGG